MTKIYRSAAIDAKNADGIKRDVLIGEIKHSYNVGHDFALQ